VTVKKRDKLAVNRSCGVKSRVPLKKLFNNLGDNSLENAVTMERI